MKYQAEIDGRRITVDLVQSDGKIRAIVGDRKYEVDVARPEDGVYLIFAENHVFEASVWPVDRDSLKVRLRDKVFTARVIDRKHRRAVADQPADGRHTLIAPMPGKVVRVLLKPGDRVGAGQGVVVVEAMKMQNEIKSPISGRVIEIRVDEGATVNSSQVLAVVE